MGLQPQEGQRFYRGKGCPMCFHTGYRGRTAVFEILIVDRALRRAIAEGAPQDTIERMALEAEFSTMRDGCLRLIQQGITTIGEAARTINTME